jgi:anoctamin-10/anoctamin-7
VYGRYESSIGDSLYLIPEGEGSPFSKMIRLKLIYYMLRAPHHQGGCGLEVSKMIFKKHLLSIFPLHDRLISDQIVKVSSALTTSPWGMPFEDLRQYFGEKIALYNVFIGHYSRWLLIPGLIGLVFQLVVWGTLNFSSPVLPFFSLIVCVWSILMLEYWKRQEAFTAMQWGMTEFEEEEPVRPEFKGHPIKSYIDGGDMLYFPPEEYLDNMANSGCVVGAYMLLVLGVVTSIYILRFSIEAQVGTYSSTIASVLNTIQITVFNYIYRSIVVKLTDYENPRTDTMYEDSLIMKLFVFQFVNSYASFFFLAFIALYLARSSSIDDDSVVGQCGASTCMYPLSINLAIIFGVRLTVTNFLDIFIPYVTYKMKIKKETEGVEDTSRLTPAEHDYMLMDYNGMLDGIECYADTAIQYGFSVLFVTALPCAPFFSLISNYFKSKLNLWKLVTVRPRAARSVFDPPPTSPVLSKISMLAVRPSRYSSTSARCPTARRTSAPGCPSSSSCPWRPW